MEYWNIGLSSRIVLDLQTPAHHAIKFRPDSVIHHSRVQIPIIPIFQHSNIPYGSKADKGQDPELVFNP